LLSLKINKKKKTKTPFENENTKSVAITTTTTTDGGTTTSSSEMGDIHRRFSVYSRMQPRQVFRKPITMPRRPPFK